ncbi:uncharacterized protein LOC126212808 isoform X1 [Schistocerca nitens]|uniref:uncharacterized protein LOC126212808 isoform X1 n=1 Tax=Schistocerca nitens TaxID=7011 RepID=UPI00211901B0|nr:uncharacterized protein LOC126212808 isoform X1 [Schistocerca nitens]
MAMQSWADSVLKYPKDVTEVSRLLREPPADARSLSAEKRGSRLFQAAVQGAARELRMLVTAGNDTEMGGGRLLWRGTALHFAAREGHVEGARCLLECSGGRQEQLSR